MSNRFCIFDIETRPLPDDKLAKPQFKAPANYKDSAKMAENLLQQEARWRDTLALDALTCRVAMIGMYQDGEEKILEGEERDIINDFWTNVEVALSGSDRRYLGFNILNFDLPVLVRRSYALDIRVPLLVRCGRYWSEQFEDLMDCWTFGRKEDRISLDALCQHLGIPGKLKGEKPFNEMTEDDLREHLKNDLRITAQVAERLLGLKMGKAVEV